MSRSPGLIKVRRRLSGVAFLLVLALLAALSVALYSKKFTNVAMVTLHTSSAGNEMHAGAEVMVRGVQVGEVRRVSADGSGATLLLAIQPGQLPRLPANVSALMLPTTLFGQRYVDLVLPARPAAARLADGSVIRQSQSADGLELEQVLNNLLPMLAAVEPDKLSLTLTAIADGLRGQGKKLGQALVTLDAYLRQMNPNLPALDTDIRRLAGLAKTYTQASPAILAALNDFSVNGQTIAAQRAQFDALLANLTTASDDLRSFLDANSANMIQLAANSIPSLQILARYSPEFPCTLSDLAAFVPKVDKVLGAGTGQPGLHAQLVVVPARGRYVAGKDTPIFGDNLGPHCYSVPFQGIHLNDGITSSASGRPAASPGQPAKPKPKPSQPARPKPGQPAKPATTAEFGTDFGPGGLAGSPAESELVRELTALALGRQPRSIPAWGSLLTAPLFRGTRVILGARQA
jgi:phospholipid/cholesterol/gamma-HCH transport system substrate-binding protein